MSCCLSMLHVHVPRLCCTSMLHVHVILARPCHVASVVLHVMLHVHVVLHVCFPSQLFALEPSERNFVSHFSWVVGLPLSQKQTIRLFQVLVFRSSSEHCHICGPLIRTEWE